jgi:hypothetical protein
MTWRGRGESAIANLHLGIVRGATAAIIRRTPDYPGRCGWPKGWGLVPRRPMDCLSAEPNRQSATGKDKGPSAGASPEVLANAAPVANGYSMIQWSPTGDWIALPSADGIAMIAPDGAPLRKLTSRKLHGFAFSRDGAQVCGIFRNISGEGAPWQLYSIDVKTGAERISNATLSIFVMSGVSPRGNAQVTSPTCLIRQGVGSA